MTEKKRRKKIELVLLDDDYNTFTSVISALQNYLPKCSVLRAEQIAQIVHHNGRCSIHTGFGPEAFIIQSRLIKRGLLVESKVYKK
jgi:ATP-dependent Clp protease adapter protein ClpS